MQAIVFIARYTCDNWHLLSSLHNIEIEPASRGEGARATVFNKVASKLVEMSQLERAFQMASSIQGSASTLQGREKNKLLADIADQFARKGERSALQIAAKVAQ